MKSLHRAAAPLGRAVLLCTLGLSLSVAPARAQVEEGLTCNGDPMIGAPPVVVATPAPESAAETATDAEASPAATPRATPAATPVPVRYRIAFVATGPSPYEATLRAAGVENAAKDVDQAVMSVAPTSDAGSSALADALAQQPDAVVVDPTGIDGAEDLLRQAVAEGVKVVTLGGDVASDARSLHIAPEDPDQLGRMSTQLMGDLLQCAGDIAVLSSAPDAQPQQTWLGSIADEITLPGYGGMRSVYTVFDEGNPQLAFDRMLQIMVAYPDLQGVIALTPETMEQAARAIQDAGKSDVVVLIGVGVPNEARPLLEQGAIDELVSPNPEAAGYLAYLAAYRLVSGTMTGAPGETLTSKKLGDFRVLDDGSVLAGPPRVTTPDTIGDVPS